MEDWDILILGTDVNEDYIDKARRGRHGEWSFRQVSDDIKERYFRRTKDEWQIDERIMAEFYKNRVLSILLTGMGRDGAEGMQEVSRAGGVTIAQDRESSIVFGMPKAAIELGAAKYVLRPDEIAETLLGLGKK